MKTLIVVLTLLTQQPSHADLLSGGKLTRFGGGICETPEQQPKNPRCLDVFINDIDEEVYGILVKKPNVKNRETYFMEILDFEKLQILETSEDQQKLLEALKTAGQLSSTVKNKYQFSIYSSK